MLHSAEYRKSAESALVELQCPLTARLSQAACNLLRCNINCDKVKTLNKPLELKRSVSFKLIQAGIKTVHLQTIWTVQCYKKNDLAKQELRIVGTFFTLWFNIIDIHERYVKHISFAKGWWCPCHHRTATVLPWTSFNQLAVDAQKSACHLYNLWY